MRILVIVGWLVCLASPSWAIQQDLRPHGENQLLGSYVPPANNVEPFNGDVWRGESFGRVAAQIDFREPVQLTRIVIPTATFSFRRGSEWIAVRVRTLDGTWSELWSSSTEYIGWEEIYGQPCRRMEPLLDVVRGAGVAVGDGSGCPERVRSLDSLRLDTQMLPEDPVGGVTVIMNGAGPFALGGIDVVGAVAREERELRQCTAHPDQCRAVAYMRLLAFSVNSPDHIMAQVPPENICQEIIDLVDQRMRREGTADLIFRITEAYREAILSAASGDWAMLLVDLTFGSYDYFRSNSEPALIKAFAARASMSDYSTLLTRSGPCGRYTQVIIE